MTIEDTARIDSRAVQTTENRFARVPLGGACSKLSPGLFKTLASICGLSFEDKAGARFTRATNIELARQAHCHAKRIGAGLVELESAGLVTVHQAGRVRTITLSSNPDFWAVWCTLELDCPVWKQHARAFKVFAGLRKFKGRNHEAFMTNPTLARFLNMNLSSVKRGFMELDDAGLVQSLTRWTGTRRQRRVVFPIVRTYPQTIPPGHEGQNSPLEDSDRGHEGQNSPLEDSRGNGRKTGVVEGQNSPSLRDKTAPHYGTKQPLTEGQNSPLEDSFKRTLNKPKTHTAHACPQGAEPQPPAGVCETGLESPPGQENQSQSQSPLEAMFDRLDIQSKIKSGIVRNEVKRAITRLDNEFGPIPAGFLEDCLTTNVNDNTVKVCDIIVQNLYKWKTYTDQERAEFTDKTSDESRMDWLKNIDTNAKSKKTYSKFTGAERVQCADGQWRDKALPAENGSGRPANEVLAERDGFSPVRNYPELRKKLNSLPPEETNMIWEKDLARKINGETWIHLNTVDRIVNKVENGEPIVEPETHEDTTVELRKDITQELKEIALKRNTIDETAKKKWFDYQKAQQKAIRQNPISVLEAMKLDRKIAKEEQAKTQEFKQELIEKYDQEERSIRAKYQPIEPKPPEPATNRAEMGLDSIPAVAVV